MTKRLQGDKCCLCEAFFLKNSMTPDGNSSGSGRGLLTRYVKMTARTISSHAAPNQPLQTGMPSCAGLAIRLLQDARIGIHWVNFDRPHPSEYSSRIFRIVPMNVSISASVPILTRRWLSIRGFGKYRTRIPCSLSRVYRKRAGTRE